MQHYYWIQKYIPNLTKAAKGVIVEKMNLMQSEIDELKRVREDLLKEVDKWQDLYLREKVR